MTTIHPRSLALMGALALLWVTSIWATASASNAIGPIVPTPFDGAQAATSAQSCLDCHSGPEHERLPVFHQDCATCHRGGPEHVAGPAADNISRPVAADCLSCHTRSPKLALWETGPHARAEVQCSECHNPHQPLARPEFTTVGNRKMDGVSMACMTCHQDTAASFTLPSHHPVREGGLSCASCHDPHGGDRLQRLARVDSCVSCHPAQRGPFVFEHAPVLEDCANCHVPHGSANRRLAELPSPSLCLQCHSLADNRHAQNAAIGARVSGAALRNCTACHAAIHGSHNDPYLRF